MRAEPVVVAEESGVTVGEVDAEELWYANGTTALYAALKAAGCQGRYVAVQPNVCPHVIAAIVASSNRPWFVDIEPERLGIDPVALEHALPEVGAVVAVHSYGVPCRIAEIARATSEAGVPLIEDCAQSEGATVAGRGVGTVAELAVFSYGEGKIVPAGGGGALLVRTSALMAGALRESASLPRTDIAASSRRLSEAFKQAYNTYYPAVPAAVRQEFTRELVTLAPALLSQATPGTKPRCLAELQHLNDTVVARRRKHAIYVAELSGVEGIKIPALPDGAVPWRFNLLLESAQRNRVFRALLQQGIHASTWYPNIGRFLAPEMFHTEEMEVADWLDERILNLWLDERTSEDDVLHAAQAVRSLAA